jgi:hypothetical protein
MDRPSADVLALASALARLHVRDAQGRDRGRVFDLRVDWVPGDERSVVTEVIYGSTGWMERVGLSEKRPDSAAWSRVRGIDGRVVQLTD